LKTKLDEFDKMASSFAQSQGQPENPNPEENK
jgi:hypothetical protein